MSKTPRSRRVVVWRSGADRKWRWSWRAANSLKRGDAGQGYARKEDAVKALEDVTGGWVEITYRERGSKGRAGYQQGFLHRMVLTSAGATPEDLLIVVNDSLDTGPA